MSLAYVSETITAFVFCDAQPKVLFVSVACLHCVMQCASLGEGARVVSVIATTAAVHCAGTVPKALQ